MSKPEILWTDEHCSRCGTRLTEGEGPECDLCLEEDYDEEEYGEYVDTWCEVCGHDPCKCDEMDEDFIAKPGLD